MYNISFLLLSHVCYLAMPTIIGAEPTTGVRVCPRSHTHSYLFIIIIYLFATCSVLYIVCNQGFSPLSVAVAVAVTSSAYQTCFRSTHLSSRLIRGIP